MHDEMVTFHNDLVFEHFRGMYGEGIAIDLFSEVT
jgi:hypothetical protein